MRHWRLGLLGFGAVGQALARLLLEAADELAAAHELTVAVGLLATRRGGVTLAADGAPPGGGVDLRTALEGHVPAGDGELHGAQAVATAPLDVVVELTPLDPAAGEPATSHVRAAIAAGRHVITANKGPIALHGPELRGLARAAGVGLRYEATLMDCLPVQALHEAAIPVGGVEAFAAIPNSTSNHVLDAMAGGRSRRDAVADAQRLGIAEADPSLDLDGWDAAFKAAILAQELLGRDVLAGDVVRTGLAAVADHEPAAAVAAGERVRLVARGERAGGAVRVAPERVPAASVLGAAGGFSMAL
ncbi:MAG TPA: hypothetical protein VF763_04070, partial [Candidatus Limnocylindrales bacterium]